MDRNQVCLSNLGRSELDTAAFGRSELDGAGLGRPGPGKPGPYGHCGLLHNMSMAPRTQVSYRIAPAGECVVWFDLSRARRANRVSRRALEIETLAADAENAWGGYDFRGAALVFPWREPADPKAAVAPVILARDLALVLNVLGRTRAQVLMAQASLCLEPAFLERSLASDDPRLVALARRKPARCGHPEKSCRGERQLGQCSRHGRGVSPAPRSDSRCSR